MRVISNCATTMATTPQVDHIAPYSDLARYDGEIGKHACLEVKFGFKKGLRKYEQVVSVIFISLLLPQGFHFEGKFPYMRPSIWKDNIYHIK